MEIQERRESKRLKIHLPVSLVHLGTKKYFCETLTKDIGSTGLRINFNIYFPTHNSFLIKLHFPEENKIIDGAANIIWCHRISFSDQYQAGLKFSEINPASEKWLQDYILSKEASFLIENAQ